MFIRNPIIFLPILSLVLFSSCGIIRIDFSGAIDQFTDFSGTTHYEDTIDCGCYEIPSYNNRPCVMIYAPVCGCDGITYSNSCVARRAGILCYTMGKCKPFGMNSAFPQNHGYFVREGVKQK